MENVPELSAHFINIINYRSFFSSNPVCSLKTVNVWQQPFSTIYCTTGYWTIRSKHGWWRQKLNYYIVGWSQFRPVDSCRGMPSQLTAIRPQSLQMFVLHPKPSSSVSLFLYADNCQISNITKTTMSHRVMSRHPGQRPGQRVSVIILPRSCNWYYALSAVPSSSRVVCINNPVLIRSSGHFTLQPISCVINY